MDKIKTAVTIDLFTDELEHINKLIDRDTEKQMIDEPWEYEGEPRHRYKCPVCRKSVSLEDNYCSTCGQKLDTENIAL